MADKIRSATYTELLAAARRTASANGSAVDVRDYEGTLAFILASSAGGGTAPTLNVKLQESSDAGSSDAWADISGAAFTEVDNDPDAHEVIFVNCNDIEGDIRVVVTITGTSPTFDCSLTMVGLKKSH